jgi:succinoglycan biosynthesis protein ExoV
MKLFYYVDPAGNFGDDLNGWMWDALLPGVLDKDDGTVMIGIGTLLGMKLPPAKKYIVFGTGTGYLPVRSMDAANGWEITAVRGPLTAAVLKLPADRAVTDGAIFLSTFAEHAPVNEADRKGILFMPHHHALKHGKWQAACAAAGIEFVDPHDDSKLTLHRLRHAKLVLADAMHAAIVADTIRVPWVPLSTSSNINSFKWLDWTQSMQVAYAPRTLPPSSPLARFDSFLGRVFGTGFHIEDLSVESAISHYHKTLSAREGRWAPIFRRISNLAMTLAKSASRSPLMKGQFRKWEQEEIERAAQALREAAAGPAYLSEDSVFEARSAEMVRRLEALKARFKTPIPEHV